MLLPDYRETGFVYHVASVTDLKEILTKGIKYDDKDTYIAKYQEFHRYIDTFKPKKVPDWVIREKAIFSSMNFSQGHHWHAHSVIMAVKINPSMCWVANENLANSLYEAFILKEIEAFKCASHFLNTKGKKLLEDYWHTSLSFEACLKNQRHKSKGYDGEVLIFHNIEPKDIRPLAIVSDHKVMSIEEWKKLFQCGGQEHENR